MLSSHFATQPKYLPLFMVAVCGNVGGALVHLLLSLTIYLIKLSGCLVNLIFTSYTCQKSHIILGMLLLLEKEILKI